MTEAISDTGPILHLHEVDRLTALSIFKRVFVPDLVVEELQTYGLNTAQLDAGGISFASISVDTEDWAAVLNEALPSVLHPADAQVFVVARRHDYRLPILTDDLALRKRLEQQQALVIGTIGILVRAYTLKLLMRAELERAIDGLFNISTLHMSRAFRAYVHQLIETLP